jgi:Flp pilus assembly protein TadB
MDLNNMENNQTDKEWNEYRQRTSEDWFQLQPEHKRETEKQLTDKIREQININTQTNKTWWTETKLWTVSSIFFITFLTLGWFYPMIVLAICLIALGALFLYAIVWLGVLLLKEILDLDDNE